MNNCIVKRKTIDIIINNKLHDRIECKYNEEGELLEGNEIVLELGGKRICDEYNNCIFIKCIIESKEVIITCDIEYYE